MARFTGEVSRSLGEYSILSGKQIKGITPDNISLGGYLGDKKRNPETLYMPLSWFAAAMQCISGDKLGIALAQYGGCAVLPRSLPVDDQADLGRKIKKAKAGFNYDVITVEPTMTIYKLMELQKKTGYSSFPVVDDKKFVGLITEKKYHPGRDCDKKVAERMILRKDVVTARNGIKLEKANDRLLSKGVGILPVLDRNDNFVSAVFSSDIKKHVDFPDEFVDDKGRYRFAGAVSTFIEDLERADALVKIGCDVLVIDTSDMKSDHATYTIKELKRRYPEIPLIAGNIIDEEGFKLAADAGADVVKVGQGPGYGCTTRKVKRTGRGQATALQCVADARNAYKKRRIPICADGGIEDTGLMNIAYAFGADFLMMGQYFGKFTESAGPIVKSEAVLEINGKKITTSVSLKQYWGEASERAANTQRYGYVDKKWFVPEGQEGVISHRGSIHDVDGIRLDIAFVKKAFSESGARNPQEFAKRVRLELQSPGSQAEGMSKV